MDLKAKLIELRERAAAKIAEAKGLLDKVKEGETPDAEVTQQVQTLYDEAKALQEECKELEAKIALTDGVADMYDFYHAPAGVVPPVADGLRSDRRETRKSVGQRFVESAEFAAVKPFAHSKGRIQAQPVQIPSLYKDLLTGASPTSAGAFVVDERLPIYVDLRQRPLVLRDLVAPGTTGSDLVEYVRQTAFTSAAAPTAEATATAGASGTKPESALAFEIVQEAVKTIAHWIPATRRALSDAGQIRSLIDSHLQIGLDLEMEDQMVNGDGTGENFTGILNTTGILVQAMGADTRLDALKKAMTRVSLSAADGGGGIPATAHLMHPLDLDEILLAKDTTGRYIIGDPAMRQGGGQVYLWGIPVAQSTVIAQNNALVAGWLLACMLWDREEATITSSDSHSDFFVRNLVAILAEMRMAFGVLRPAGICHVDFGS
jgi:HK97 family phage major capsid protein